MKKITAIIFVLIVTLGIAFIANSLNRPVEDIKQIVRQSYRSTDYTSENLYHDAISAFLTPHVDKSIEDWYSKNPQYIGGTVDPWGIKVLSVERIPDQTSKLWFNIKVEVMPYVLAHISTGRDRITFMLKPTGEVTVEKYEHIESFPLPRRN